MYIFQISFSSFVLFLVWPYGTYHTAYPNRHLDVLKLEEYGVRGIYTKIWKMTLAKVKCLPVYIWKLNSPIPKISTAHFASRNIQELLRGDGLKVTAFSFTGFRTDFIISFPRVYN